MMVVFLCTWGNKKYQENKRMSLEKGFGGGGGAENEESPMEVLLIKLRAPS